MDAKTLQDLKSLITDTLSDITISNPEKTENLTKIKIRRMELKGKVQYQIEEFTKTQAFHKNVTLTEDLGADSLDAVELNMSLEESFEISIPDEELANFKTVQDIVTYIENNKYI